MHPKFCSFLSVPLVQALEPPPSGWKPRLGQASLGGRKGVVTQENGGEAMFQEQNPKEQTIKKAGVQEAG